MTIVDKSRKPYFDDYDAEKNFHEILFLPSRPVQIRELNQIQSMFKAQVERFGDHVFKDGSMVIAGSTNYDLESAYVTSDTITNYETVLPQLKAGGLQIRSVTNDILANVKQFVEPEGADAATFYLEYLRGSTDGLQSEFVNGETVEFIQNNQVITTALITTAGFGSRFTISSGVYYMRGRFVLVPEQTVVLSKYSDSPSAIVALKYVESVVTENEDSTLFDNAQGTTNFSGPGAHRLSVDVSLAVFDLTDAETLDEDSYEIFRIENGIVQKKVDKSEYNILADTMAQRTYEESGDYTVRAFNIGFQEHDSDVNKFNVNLEAGLAYVRGYRVENLSTKAIEVDKARTTAVLNNSAVSASIGHYILVQNDLNIIPNVNSLQKISFYDGAVGTPATEPAGSVLGTARIRFVQEDGSDYRLHLFDVRDAAGNLSTAFIPNAVSIYSSEGNPITATLVANPELYDPVNYPLVFPTTVEFVKSLYDGIGNSDTSYSSVKQVNTSTDTNGVVTLSAAANELFVAQNADYAFASFTDTDEFAVVAGNAVLSGSPTGSIITIDFGVGNASRPVRLNLQVAKSEVMQKTKTTTQTTKVGSLDGDGRLYLDKADAFEIVSVIDSDTNDVTDKFTLFTNKNLSFYDVSYVEGAATGVVYPVTVTFKYFQHSAGDFFSADSYADVDYDDIPEEAFGRLSDALDFRPRIADDRSGFTGTGSVVGNIPTPFTLVTSDVEHYLPRLDKIYVDKDGNFGVVQGEPELQPKYPNDPANAMVLYEMVVPPYTFSLSDVSAVRKRNRRYTMRDIGKLEQRISNVEYYVTLNQLEQEADSKNITDPATGLTRFKNGFMTDAFVDHSIGDYAWDGYRVSVADEGELRPEFSLNAFDLEYNALASSNVVVNDDVVTLPFTHESYLNQFQRSSTMNVNPYAVFRWESNIRMSPAADSWFDNQYTDPDVTYRVFNNGRLTQTWKSWELNWVGGSHTVVSSEETTRRFSRTSAPHSERGRRTTRRFLETTNTTTADTIRTNIEVVSDRVLDTSVIPYMRSIEVLVTGKGNKPRTRMYFFFDGKNVNNYIKPSGGSYGQNVIADDNGDFIATFRIPNNSTLRFRTGEKVLEVTDNEFNNKEKSTSHGSTVFTSTGIRNIRQRTIIATRTTTSRVLSREVTTRQTSVRWWDPLAQSFLVEQTGGVFITRIGLYFATKDPSVPVTLEIREMDNGLPTQSIVPNAQVLLNPADVAASPDGTNPTVTWFEFPAPVYLPDGNEYCFVVLSNSNNYEAWVARMGELDLGSGKPIAKQPYAGVLFKSQNNSTWTPDQSSDLMFHIQRAEFDTGVTGNLVLNNKDITPIVLDTNSLETVDTDTQVIVHMKRHNFVAGAEITFTNAVGGNGLADNDINVTTTVVSVLDPNRFVVDFGVAATASGFVGGAVAECSNMYQASLLHPNVPNILPTKTAMQMSVTGTTGKSYSGVENAYQALNTPMILTNNEDNELRVPWLITNEADEALNYGGNKSFTMNITLSSTQSNLSPVVDLSGANVITPFTLIDSDVSQADGANNWANYRTTKTGLKNPANSLRLYIDADKPQFSDIVISARTANTSEELDVATWTTMNTVVSQVSGEEGFLENEFSLENLDDFTWYQVMIQLKSTNCAVYPVCKRLRVLALGT